MFNNVSQIISMISGLITIISTIILIKSKLSKHGISIMIRIALIIAIPTFLLSLFVSFFIYYNVTISDITVKRNEERLNIENKTITSEVIEQINKLKKLRYLDFEKCIFDDGVLSNLNLALYTFSMSDCKGVANYSFVSNMKELKTLDINNCDFVSDNISLKELVNLTNISIKNNNKFNDLSILPIQNLTYLNFSGTAVNDLSSLSKCENLEEIYGDYTPVSDLSPLASLTNLQIMHFNNCSIKTIMKDFMSLRMKNISFSNNNITNCSGFKNFTILNYVDFDNNELNDISWLAKSKRTLEKVIISNNPLSFDQINFLHNCTSIETLYLDGIDIQSLEAVVQENLVTLHAINCNITNISALQGLQHLSNIDISKNKITDISPLNSLKNKRLSYVNLSENNITDISMLCNSIKVFVLYKNPILINKDTFENIYGDTIILDYKDGLSNSLIDFKDIYILDCPLDQKVTIEDTFKSNRFIRYFSSSNDTYESSCDTVNFITFDKIDEILNSVR